MAVLCRGKKKHFAVVRTKQNNNPFYLIEKSLGENGPMLSPAVILVGGVGGQALFFCQDLDCGSCSIFPAFVGQKWRPAGDFVKSAWLCCVGFLSWRCFCLEGFYFSWCGWPDLLLLFCQQVVPRHRLSMVSWLGKLVFILQWRRGSFCVICFWREEGHNHKEYWHVAFGFD